MYTHSQAGRVVTEGAAQTSELCALLQAQQRIAGEVFDAVREDYKRRQRGGDQALLGRLRTTPTYARAFEVPEPLVTIIIPTYQRARLILERTLPSVCAQQYPRWEVIIVGDAMASEQAQLLAGIRDPRVRFINLKRRGAYPEQRAPRWYVAGIKPVNFGLRIARGDWIVHLDDDDELLPDHIAMLLAAARTQRVEWAHGKVEFREPHLGASTVVGCATPRMGGIARISSVYHAALKTFRYNPQCWRYNYPGDWDLWERFLDMGVTHTHVDRIVAVHHGTLTEVLDHYAQEPTSADAEGSGGSTGAHLHRDAHYETWLAKHSLEEIDGQLFAERMMLKWRSHPLLQLVCVARRGEEHLLAATIDSIAPQMYKHWRLTIVAEFPPPDPLFEQHEQLRWIELADGQSPAATVNSALQDLPDAWVALLRPGIRLAPQLLLSCADYINVREHWRLIYTDSDVIDEHGVRSAPSFRPDINVDLLRATPYLGEFLLVHAKTLVEIGGLSEIDGSEGYDLALRVVESCGESAIGHISDVLYHVPLLPSMPSARVRERLVQHLARCAVAARVEPGFLPGTHRVVYQHTRTPLVSIVIPTRDKLEYLKPCIESLAAKTGYSRWELIVVDNQSSDPDTLAYLDDLPRRFGERARVLRYPFAFNFSAMCNMAARDSRGEYLLFLNNDTEIVQPEWLERMMHHAQRPEVGIVGARLVYPESGKIQHAGVILGMDGVAEHPYVGLLGLEDPGYLGRALVDQNLSAVTGACLLVRKSVYEQVGGMDEHAFAVSYNDVDLCLKVGSQGHKIVWTPHATLVHHGNVSQNAATAESLMKKAIAAERFEKERANLLDKWLPWIANDPAYNRHLSLAHRDCRVETDVVINWDTTFHDRRRVLGIPLSGGSGEYRVIQPLRALSRAGHVQHDIVTAPLLHQTRLLSVAEVARAAPDVLAFHAAVSDGEQEALRQLRRHYQALYVFHLDDLITDVPEKSAVRKRAYRDAKPRLRRALSMCDRLIVTTEPLAELCRSMIADIRIIPNRLERAVWGALRSQRRRGPRARVGWAGAQQHQGDLALLREVVQATAKEVDWVFFGMCPEELRPYVREVHDFELGFSAYARKLASLDLDLAVAPLELHPFNEAKSNLRLLEYGILGWPVVCTDILPYHGAPVRRVPNQPRAWIEAIRERIHDLDAAGREGAQLKEWVLRNFMLEDHLEEWLNALGPSTAAQTTPQKTLKTA